MTYPISTLGLYQTSIWANLLLSCSLLKFIVRALPHWFYFTPKPAIFPPPPLAHRPYIGIIFGTNIICILFHLIFAPPAAGEATRGYLHGGLVIDFIGQTSPVGRWRLVGLDIIVLALQVLILGVTLERRGTKSTDGMVNGVAQVGTENRQDHDSEERGILRQDTDTGDDIELQDLQHSSAGRTGGDEDRERDELISPGGTSEPYNQHALDPFYTGGHVVANLHILDTIRAQWQASGVSAEGSDAAATSGVQAATVAMAGRTFTYRLGEGIRRSV